MRHYGYFRSSAAWRVRIALNLKGVAHENIVVHLRKGEQKTPEHLSRNPQGLVPALETGGETLTQSLAILEWLEEAHPEPPLLPADPITRAHARAVAQIIACDIHPLQNLRVLTYLRDTFGADQAAVEHWCQRWIGAGLAAVEELLQRADRGQPFAFGDTPGMADICLVPQLYGAERFKVDISGLARVRAVGAACGEHPAFQQADLRAQPDYED